jgi:hypothetical protein
MYHGGQTDERHRIVFSAVVSKTQQFWCFIFEIPAHVVEITHWNKNSFVVARAAILLLLLLLLVLLQHAPFFLVLGCFEVMEVGLDWIELNFNPLVASCRLWCSCAEEKITLDLVAVVSCSLSTNNDKNQRLMCIQTQFIVSPEQQRETVPSTGRKSKYLST